MLSPAHTFPSPRSRRLVGWVMGVMGGAMGLVASVVLCPNAEASPGARGDERDERAERADQGENKTESPSLGSTKFGTPRLSWSMTPPPLRLQPEGARLMLELPREWMPAPDFGRLGIPLDPNKHWEFRRATRMTRATLGTSVHLHVSDRARSIDFGLSLLPRAAIATLRFDPLGPPDK
jgi:hypothetical protein